MLAVNLNNIFKEEINTRPQLQNICQQNVNNIYLDYRYFKYLAHEDNYVIIIQHILSSIEDILKTHNQFIVHIFMKSLTISEIDKHKTFIYKLSDTLKQKFPDKLDTCFVYRAPFIFSHIYNIISIFIDKKTQKKIKVVE